MATIITDAQIRALRTEAASVGDYTQLIMCDIALNEYASDSSVRRRQIESHSYGKLLSPKSVLRLSVTSQSEAEELCSVAINNARAQADS